MTALVDGLVGLDFATPDVVEADFRGLAGLMGASDWSEVEPFEPELEPELAVRPVLDAEQVVAFVNSLPALVTELLNRLPELVTALINGVTGMGDTLDGEALAFVAGVLEQLYPGEQLPPEQPSSGLLGWLFPGGLGESVWCSPSRGMLLS